MLFSRQHPDGQKKPSVIVLVENVSGFFNLSWRRIWHWPCSRNNPPQTVTLCTSIATNEEVICMLYVISYRKKHASSKSRKSFFAEHNQQPSLDQIQALVNKVGGGNFAEKLLRFRNAPDLIPTN
jgi:hypothetical protein